MYWARGKFQQWRAEHAGAATRIENSAYRQADVLGMRDDQPGPVAGFDFEVTAVRGLK